MTKRELKRKKARDRQRRHRTRKAAEVSIQQFIAEAKAEADRKAEAARIAASQPPRLCAVCKAPGCSTNINGVDYCGKHGAEAIDRPASWPASELPPLPPIPDRPDPLAFHTADDPFRPSWWKDVDPHGAEITVSVNPRAALRAVLVQGEGQHTVKVGGDPGITFSPEAGHVDMAAKQAEAAEARQKASGR